jgi:hypothetical protein
MTAFSIAPATGGARDGLGGSECSAATRPSPLPAVDMSPEGQALALAYAGDASWQSICILQREIFTTLWHRHIAPIDDDMQEQAA